MTPNFGKDNCLGPVCLRTFVGRLISIPKANDSDLRLFGIRGPESRRLGANVPGLPLLMVAKTVTAQTMTEVVINNNRRTAG